MRLIKRTEEYVVDTEEEAIKAIQNFREDAAEHGHTVGASGYTYKTKKAKGEIIGEQYLIKVTRILGGIWDDYE